MAVPQQGVRPTAERARQAFFDILGPQIIDVRFADLFAGSGIFAFEAVSRGAAESVAVDISRRQTAAIEKLAREWDAPVTTYAGDAIAAIARIAPFDIAWADPPYDFERYRELAAALGSAPGWSLAAIEHRRRTDPFTSLPESLQVIRRAEYGEVWVTFFERSG